MAAFLVKIEAARHGLRFLDDLDREIDLDAEIRRWARGLALFERFDTAPGEDAFVTSCRCADMDGRRPSRPMTLHIGPPRLRADMGDGEAPVFACEIHCPDLFAPGAVRAFGEGRASARAQAVDSVESAIGLARVVMLNDSGGLVDLTGKLEAWRDAHAEGDIAADRADGLSVEAWAGDAQAGAGAPPFVLTCRCVDRDDMEADMALRVEAPVARHPAVQVCGVADYSCRVSCVGPWRVDRRLSGVSMEDALREATDFAYVELARRGLALMDAGGAEIDLPNAFARWSDSLGLFAFVETLAPGEADADDGAFRFAGFCATRTADKRSLRLLVGPPRLRHDVRPGGSPAYVSEVHCPRYFVTRAIRAPNASRAWARNDAVRMAERLITCGRVCVFDGEDRPYDLVGALKAWRDRHLEADRAADRADAAPVG